jgi:hypothetical protein
MIDVQIYPRHKHWHGIAMKYQSIDSQRMHTQVVE